MAGTKQDMIVYHPKHMALQKKMRPNGSAQMKRIGPYRMTVRKFRNRRGVPSPLIRRGGE